MIDLIEYGGRAGNSFKSFNPIKSLQLRLAALKVRERDLATSTPHTFYADIAEFQPLVNSKYPYNVICLRGDNGWRIDDHFAANWRYCAASSRIEIVIVYLIYIPGETSAILSRIKSALGSRCPSKVVFMVDVESGAGFAGPGNHSIDANRLANGLALYAGSNRRVLGYANKYDWAACWPQYPSWMKRITASYGTTNPNTWGWQYYGGMNYPTPAGYPRSCAPFGAWVDMDVVPLTVTQMKEQCGLVVPKPPIVVPELGDKMIVVTVDPKTVPKGVTWPGDFVFNGSSLKHVAPSVGTTSNVTSLLQALDQTAMAVITYEQYLEWK